MVLERCVRVLLCCAAGLTLMGSIATRPAAAEEPKDKEPRRITSDDDPLFGDMPMRIDFDKDPDGKVPEVSKDIGKRFVAWGVVFSTPKEDTFVSIAPYNVGGRSEGRCAAVFKPLYQGAITIRFCKPGDAEKPAAVHSVGCWVAHVAENGTTLHAYDPDGKEIHAVAVLRNQRDFLGLHSGRPIARVEIVPDDDIDPDFAIDDLTFDKPAPLP